MRQLIDQCASTETLTDFAARAGLSRRQVFNLCSGTAGLRPFTPTITKLAKALRVKPARVRAAIETSRAAAEHP